MTAPPRAGTETAVAPPDGGWGWVVVFASFMIHVFTDGLTYSFGVFMTEFFEYFGGSKQASSWILSIMVGVTLCSGPVSSALVNKYGCRPVTIGGGLLASASLFASAFATNLFTLYITSGLLTGLGFGLIYLPAIVSVTCYFERLRSLATGIAVCGSGFGTFVLAPVIVRLIKMFQWDGAMLIVSGLMLNTIVFGILFRPLKATKKVYEVVAAEEEPKVEEVKRMENGGRPHSVHGHESMFSSHNTLTVRNGGLQGDTARMALSQPMLQNLHKERRGSIKGSGVMYRKDVLYSGSLAHISTVSKSAQWIPLEKVDTKSERLRKISVQSPEEEEEEEITTKMCGITCSQETSDAFKEMVDFSLLKDPVFIVYTASNFLTSLGFNVPHAYIQDFALTFDLDKEWGGYLISILGISNTLGRLILGYISDKPWVNRFQIYIWSLTICGIGMILSIFCTGFVSLAMFASLYGFFIGAYVGLTSVILVDLLGLDKLTNAFGILLLFQGAASLVGPPITGSLFDNFGSYTPGFLFCGVTMAISGLMLYAIPPLQKRIAATQPSLPS